MLRRMYQHDGLSRMPVPPWNFWKPQRERWLCQDQQFHYRSAPCLWGTFCAHSSIGAAVLTSYILYMLSRCATVAYGGSGAVSAARLLQHQLRRCASAIPLWHQPWVLHARVQTHMQHKLRSPTAASRQQWHP